MKVFIQLVLFFYLFAIESIRGADFTLTPTGETTDAGFVEIIGVEAGPFDPGIWQGGPLNLLSDVRTPMLEPQDGKWRNIYAPSVIETGDGWRVFFGAWDGVPSGNDHIYSLVTKDFLKFDERHTVIEHGPFQHVCNVTAVTVPPTGIALMCTAYPDSRGLNKPAFFTSPDGKVWNGSPAPYTATTNDIIRIHGYEKYEAANINGMNVLLRDGKIFRLYFANFKDFGRIYRASGTNGTDFQFDGPVLNESAMPNDVKTFRVGSTNHHLMGLHRNGDRTWSSLSPDGTNFPPMKPLFTNASPAERYIVAVGWVTQGEQEKSGRRLLGVLYGAGAKPSLDQNRIFARWLQPQIVIRTADGRRFVGNAARGPNRQRIAVEGDMNGAEFQVSDETGTRPLGEWKAAQLIPGRVYRLSR